MTEMVPCHLDGTAASIKPLNVRMKEVKRRPIDMELRALHVHSTRVLPVSHVFGSTDARPGETVARKKLLSLPNQEPTGGIINMSVFNFHLNELHQEPGKNDAMYRAIAPRVHFLLDNLQSPINIGKCARVAEIFGMDLYIHDPHYLVEQLDALQTIGDFACGAWERRARNIVKDVGSFAGEYKQGRVIATCLDKDAIRLQDFEFADNDLIMFGNEYDGLPSDLIERADAKLFIPMPKLHLPKPYSHRPIDPARSAAVNQNGIPNLNVAVAAGIVGYEFSRWLEKKGYLSEDFQDAQDAESHQITKACC